MSSSTSSFRNELKVIACVLLVLAGLEVAMRAGEERLSVDIAHIRSGDEISTRVGDSARPTLLLLGNSLTREGIAPVLLESAAGGDLLVEAYYPDGSSVNEWAYAYRRYFAEPGNAPDYLVIGAGRSHLFDSDLPPDRFGAYFCSRQDIPRYFRRHVHDPDDAAGFFLARSSAAYTNRHRVQPRVFSVLVPHYQEVLPRLATRARLPAEVDAREDTHRNLAELLAVAREAGTRVAVVAIPMPEPYPLPDSTRRVISDAGATLIDARDLPGIEVANFPDNYHLDPAGATIVTEYLVSNLQPLWWPENSHGD